MINSSLKRFKNFGLGKLTVLFIYLAIFFLVLYTPVFIKKFFHQKKTLSICTFADLFDKDLIDQFERDSGIKVHVKYCELDSEFWTQLYESKGEGFDLVTPTDFIVERLINHGLVKKINKNALHNLKGIHKCFLKKDFDLDLDYSLPFAWNYYAIGFSKKDFAQLGVEAPSSLQEIFNPDKSFPSIDLEKYKVAMFEDNPQELVALGAIYLAGNNLNFLDKNFQKEIVDLYVEFKQKWLYGFVFSNMQYYLSSVVPIVICFASLLKDLLEEEGDKFGAIFPKEGSVAVPQNFCIPIGAQNLDSAHKFVDYFMNGKNMLKIFESSGYMPVKTSLLTEIRENSPELRSLVPPEQDMDRLFFINKSLTPEATERMWLSVKSFV